jgi:hypothetical protein
MIAISIDQPTSNFRPGEIISGTVSWSDLAPQTEGLETRLLWYTEGKGSQDVEVVDSVKHEAPQSAGSFRFEFVAPTRPFSFSGKLISLLWTIEVVLFPSHEGFREPLTISSDGSEIKLDRSFGDTALQPSLTLSR